MTINITTVPVENWPVEDVHPYPFNHKKHPEKQIEMLMRSIKTQGLIEPIIVDGAGVIISGHGRFEACKRLGMTKVNVRVLRGITEEQASALRIAANKTASNEYDTDMLQRELEKLSHTDIDLGALGFDQKELDMLLTDVGELDEDAISLDINTDIETHEAEVSERAEKADGEDVRLDKALGFKTIPLPAQKIVTRAMAVIEEQTGKQGADALIAHMRAIVEAA